MARIRVIEPGEATGKLKKNYDDITKDIPDNMLV